MRQIRCPSSLTFVASLLGSPSSCRCVDRVQCSVSIVCTRGGTAVKIRIHVGALAAWRSSTPPAQVASSGGRTRLDPTSALHTRYSPSTCNTPRPHIAPDPTSRVGMPIGRNLWWRGEVDTLFGRPARTPPKAWDTLQGLGSRASEITGPCVGRGSGGWE